MSLPNNNSDKDSMMDVDGTSFNTEIIEELKSFMVGLTAGKSVALSALLKKVTLNSASIAQHQHFDLRKHFRTHNVGTFFSY